jgi:transcriptional regulator with XRE-family HTH domain
MRLRRAELGITQADLAEQSGMDRSYIGQVERGERNPTLDIAGRIAEGLDAKPSALLASAENRASDSDE